MKPFKANAINALILLVFGLWGYFGTETHSPTALIPVLAGLVLLIFTPWFRKGNKVIAHIAVTITLLIFIALFKPLTGSIGRGNTISIFRVSVMVASSLFSMIIFVKSFVDARIKK